MKKDVKYKKNCCAFFVGIVEYVVLEILEGCVEIIMVVDLWFIGVMMF